MRKFIFMSMMLFSGFCVWAQTAESLNQESSNEQRKIRVACIGNSITEGYGLSNPADESYPSVLDELLGEDYEVGNFGKSARTLMNKGDVPYMKEDAYKAALQYMPDIVTIKLGTNDTKPHNWQYNEDFEKDLATMVEAFKALPSKPQIYICFPVPVVHTQWGINDSTVVNGVIPAIKRVAIKENVPTIDLYTPMKPYLQLMPDNVHPNKTGAMLIAHEICEKIRR